MTGMYCVSESVCGHSEGYFVSSKRMWCPMCGHQRQIVPLPAHMCNEGFRLSRTVLKPRRYEYALTRHMYPIVEDGVIFFPTSVRHAKNKIKQILIEEP